MKSGYRANIWKYYLFMFFSNLAFFGGVLIPFFTEWGGISYTQVMFLQSWFMFWIFVLEVPTGVVADYLGRKQSVVLGAIIQMTAVLVYSIKPSFYIFLLGEFMFATSVALLSGASEAFVYDSLKKTKETKKSKKIFGRSHTFKLIGIMVAAPIGSIIAANISLRAPMYLFSIPLFISALISLTFKEPKTSKRVESTRYIKILKDGVGFFRKNKTLQILAVDMIVISVMGYFMIWLYQPMLKQAGIDIAYFGFVHSGLVIAQIILANTFGVFEKILKSKKGFVLMGSLTVGVMYIIGGLTTFVPLVLLSIILGGGFGLTRKPLFSGYINKYIPSPKRATVLSTVSMFQRLLTTVLNPLIGVMVDWSLNYTLISLGTVAIFFAFISRVKEEHLID